MHGSVLVVGQRQRGIKRSTDCRIHHQRLIILQRASAGAKGYEKVCSPPSRRPHMQYNYAAIVSSQMKKYHE
jgi:hypothetical protein